MADEDDNIETPEVDETEESTDEGQEPEEGSDAEGAAPEGDEGTDGVESDEDKDPRLLAQERKAHKANLEAKNLRERIKALEAENRTYKDGELSEKEKLARDLDDSGKTAAELRAENSKLKIQRDFPDIDDDLYELVGEGDYEVLQVRAQKLADKLAAAKAAVKTKKSAPAGDLKGGSDPAGNVGTNDPRELVKGWRR